ncbi:Uncharacterised protein [Corynebacterium renale]|uniref:Uncharacterized protein n=1 Tax=Corynebacterium renale TaxID=1724 RepID=A0A2A9DM22_9CORY|nr:hypothetical protein ATK06_0720 [Corynebacterium renale]SQI22466.1 Uncharacterised protein [Corynebacterium renale]
MEKGLPVLVGAKIWGVIFGVDGLWITPRFCGEILGFRSFHSFSTFVIRVLHTFSWVMHTSATCGFIASRRHRSPTFPLV